jgi:hypothetical protein
MRRSIVHKTKSGCIDAHETGYFVQYRQAGQEARDGAIVGVIMPAKAPVRTLSDQDMRDQEVLRAMRDLAAYFRGRRTEREARAALKIIKAFVRDRERQPAKTRPPLPGMRATRRREPARKKRRKPSSVADFGGFSDGGDAGTPTVD